MTPTFGNGKICYVEIPATDVQQSADFYRNAFGWQVRTRGDGSVAFDDGVGQVSGTWLLGVPPTRSPGLLIHIMVDDMNATLTKIAELGAEIVQPVGAHLPEITARFRDPGGNVIGLYQHRGG